MSLLFTIGYINKPHISNRRNQEETKKTVKSNSKTKTEQQQTATTTKGTTRTQHPN